MHATIPINYRDWELGFKVGPGRTDLVELDQACFEARGEQVHDGMMPLKMEIN